MRTVRKIAKNTGGVIAGNVAFGFISLFVIVYLARYLGTEGFGKYSFVFVYLAFFNIITDLGLQQILVREMAREPSTTPKLIGNAYVIRLLLTVFAVGLTIIIITLLPYPADTTLYVYIASFTLLFMRLFNLILIPAMGYNGAVIATVATVVVLALSLFHFVSKHLHNPRTQSGSETDGCYSGDGRVRVLFYKLQCDYSGSFSRSGVHGNVISFKDLL